MIPEAKIPCTFDTERLTVSPLNKEVDLHKLAAETVEILSPEVTQSLPPGWHNIDRIEKAKSWILERAAESTILLVQSKLKGTVLGFIFLYTENGGGASEIRFGYLLGKESWGKGIGTEVLRGFVGWAKENQSVKSISGGVEKSNIGSIKVLEKVGFTEMESNSDTIFYEYIV